MILNLKSIQIFLDYIRKLIFNYYKLVSNKSNNLILNNTYYICSLTNAVKNL